MGRVLDKLELKTDEEDAIKIDTLDNITADLGIKHIDLVMMDIEGHEIHALEGMKELLSKKAMKHLTIEIHPAILREIGISDAEVIQILARTCYKVDKFHKESDAAYDIQADSI